MKYTENIMDIHKQGTIKRSDQSNILRNLMREGK